MTNIFATHCNINFTGLRVEEHRSRVGPDQEHCGAGGALGAAGQRATDAHSGKPQLAAPAAEAVVNCTCITRYATNHPC